MTAHRQPFADFALCRHCLSVMPWNGESACRTCGAARLIDYDPQDRPRFTVAVTGGRDFDDEACVHDTLDIISRVVQIDPLVHGAARGADALAAAWAARHGVPMRAYPADWSKGPSAGPERNRRMLDDAKPHLLVVFPGGRGTEDCTAAARFRRIPLWRP